MASDSVQPAGVADSYADVERIVFGVVMIAAPILMLGAAIFHPPHGIENAAGYFNASHDHSTAFYVAHTCFFLSAVLFVAAIVGLARLVHPSHPKAAFWGCILSLMGFVGYGALDGIDYMAWVAGKPGEGLDPTTMEHYIEAVLTTNAILVPVLLVFTLLPIGLIVLAVGAARASVLPGWLAALMPLGMVGVAGSLQSPPLDHLSPRAARQLRAGRSEAAAGSECPTRRGAHGVTGSRRDTAHSLVGLRPERITVLYFLGITVLSRSQAVDQECAEFA